MTVQWLSVPEFADRLGWEHSKVRDKLREGHLVAVRRGANDALHLPAEFIVMGDHAEHVLPTLKGTLTVLGDMGLDDDEAMAWLLTDNDELGMAPLECLRNGQRAAVRRAAQVLL